MKVTQKALADYRGEVDRQAELAKAFVEQSLDTYFANHPQATTADGREFAIDLLKAALPNFTDAAGTLAADFFDEMMEAQGIDARAQLYDSVDYDTVEEKVRYFAGELNGGDEKSFKDQVADATRYFVKRSAYDNMVMNCEGNSVRYARVPSGLETCSFCFMLASRGFVYHSEAKALGMHGYHDNCSCTVVPGSKVKGESRVKIEGYDPEVMYRNWLACEKAIGGREEARKEWLALSDVERDDYIARHETDAKAFARFEQNRIMREVETRDWHWLYAGETPEVDYSRSPRSDYGLLKKSGNYSPDNITHRGKEWRDLVAHDTLSAYGFRVAARSPKGLANSYKHIDLYINGELWEVKSPENTKPWDPAPKDALNFIHDNFGKADSQFRHQYDAENNCELDYRDKKRVVLNMTYRDVPIDEIFIERIKVEAEVQHIDEVLLIVGDGRYGIGEIIRVK